MGTISNARASIGLQASGTPTGTNVKGAVNIGQPQITLPFDDADIAYSFTVTSTGSSDRVTLALATGSVSQTTGTPTITDGDGNDFEGVALPQADNLYAALAVSGPANSASVDFSGFSQILSGDLEPDSVFLAVNTLLLPGTQIITFNAAGDSVTVTVIGKSS